MAENRSYRGRFMPWADATANEPYFMETRIAELSSPPAKSDPGPNTNFMGHGPYNWAEVPPESWSTQGPAGFQYIWNFVFPTPKQLMVKGAVLNHAAVGALPGMFFATYLFNTQGLNLKGFNAFKRGAEPFEANPRLSFWESEAMTSRNAIKLGLRWGGFTAGMFGAYALATKAAYCFRNKNDRWNQVYGAFAFGAMAGVYQKSLAKANFWGATAAVVLTVYGMWDWGYQDTSYWKHEHERMQLEDSRFVNKTVQGLFPPGYQSQKTD